MYDSVDCRFFGDENFYGFAVSYEGKKGWEYDKIYFYDAVLDFLNKDYFALCGVRTFKAKNYPHDVDDPRMLLVEGVQLSEKLNNLKISHNKFEEDIKEDLKTLETHNIRELVNHVLLINNENDKFDVYEKLNAYMYEASKNRQGILNYSAYTQVECDSLNDDGVDDTKTLILSYEFKTMSDMIKYLICVMMRKNISVKICKNCGKYFVPFRSDTIYCDNDSPQDENRTCKEYGKYAVYLDKSRNDEATKLYKQIYNIRANKLKRCDSIKLREDFDIFRANAKQWKADVKAGVKTEQEYIKWLKSIKGKEDVD